MKYAFYGSLLIAAIINFYFGIYKEMYSTLYAEAINTICMTFLFFGIAYEGFQKSKNKKSQTKKYTE